MIVLIAIVSFFLSLIVLYIGKRFLSGGKLYTGDTFFHLLVIGSIRENNWRFPSSLDNVTFLYDIKPYNYLLYPPLLHYIVALFPRRLHLKIADSFNLLVFSFMGCTAAVLSYSITLNPVAALVSSLVTIFNLSIFEQAVMFTPRPLGLLFYTIGLCMAVIYPQNLFLFTAIAVLTALICLTHKFATQALVFGFVPYALIFNKPYFLLSTLLGFLLAILLSKGFYLKVLKEHYNWIYYYSLHPRREHPETKLKRILGRNFWYLPIVASMIFTWVLRNEGPAYVSLLVEVIFWAFIPIVAALLVSIRAFSFLGEEYRYVEYGTVPTSVVFSSLLINSNAYYWFLSLACVVLCSISLYKFKSYIHNSSALVDSNDVSVYGSLKNQSLGKLVVLPHIRTLEINYFTGLSVAHPVRLSTPQTPEMFSNMLAKQRIEHIIKFKYYHEEFTAVVKTKGLTRIMAYTNFEVYRVTL